MIAFFFVALFHKKYNLKLIWRNTDVSIFATGSSELKNINRF